MCHVKYVTCQYFKILQFDWLFHYNGSNISTACVTDQARSVSLKMLPQIISLMHKHLFHIPYLASENYSDKWLLARRHA